MDGSLCKDIPTISKTNTLTLALTLMSIDNKVRTNITIDTLPETLAVISTNISIDNNTDSETNTEIDTNTKIMLKIKCL